MSPTRVVLLAALLLAGCAQLTPYPAAVHAADLGPRDDRALVLIPGWCSDGRVFDLQREAFAAAHRTLVVDLPGHGESPPSPVGYAMDDLALAVLAAMDAAGVERAVLVGHSNGTPVARQVARLVPERVAGLVTLDGAFLAMGPSDPEAIDQVLRSYAGETGLARVRAMFRGMLHPDLDEARREDVLAMVAGVDEQARLDTLAASLDPAIWDDDPIEVPVLAITAQAPFWTSDYWDRVAPILPDLTRHELAGVSHFLQFDEAERVNRLVLDWVAERGLLD